MSQMMNGGNNMKICISSEGKSKDSLASRVFGRCTCFALYDTDNKSLTFADNMGKQQSGGAGIKAASQIAEAGVKTVITGRVGPNARRVLDGAKVEVYKSNEGKTIEEQIRAFEEGDLPVLEETSSPHVCLGEANCHRNGHGHGDDHDHGGHGHGCCE